MHQVKREWFCAPYVGRHLCRLTLHLWSPLHASGTFLAPLVYLLMPRKTNECYLKAYSLLDFAITLLDGVGVMIDFEVAMRAAWTELQPTHHVPDGIFDLTQVLKPWVKWTRGARLGGFATLEQFHSSEVIAKPTCSALGEMVNWRTTKYSLRIKKAYLGSYCSRLYRHTYRRRLPSIARKIIQDYMNFQVQF